MSIDVLILNTAVIDCCSNEFNFVKNLVGPGGLAKCKTDDLPAYTQQQYKVWIDKGFVTAGGSANVAPLVAKAGLKVEVGINLGRGDFDGLDAQGRFFYDTMVANDVGMSEIFIHPDLPTGTTFIYENDHRERGGLAYFPNANNDFDFERFKSAVEKLKPKIVYYMYSGLSDRGDANGGKDLAEFIRWCRGMDIITIVDSATLAGNPKELAYQGQPVEDYKLLAPVLPELDLFFTSSDEIKMILNTLDKPRQWAEKDDSVNIKNGLTLLTDNFWKNNDRTRLFGVTVENGAYEMHMVPGKFGTEPKETESKFMFGKVVNLVGAGDSFRAGLVAYIAKNIKAFKDGIINFDEAIQMGSLFASLYIKTSLDNRYSNIKPYEKMLRIVQSNQAYDSFDELIKTLQ